MLNDYNTAEALRSDFILGGICFKSEPNITKLFGYYEEQGIVNELKARHLFRHNHFENDFCGDRVTALLKWFETNPDVFLHYAIQNNFYFALVDIVDSVLDSVPHVHSFHIELKDALYQACKIRQDDILDLLCKYEYPNVSSESMRNFTTKLSRIIDDENTNDDFMAEMLRQMLKAVKNSEMPFIVDNKPFVLQESYDQLYLNRMITFRDSELVFDTEPEIVKRLSAMRALKELSNCTFVDSRSDKYVQIADCIVAILSKVFSYMDSLSDDELYNGHKSERFIANMQILKALIERSDSKNVVLILNLNAQSLTNERYCKICLLSK